MTPPRVPVILLASRDQQLMYLIQRYAGNCGCQLLQTEDIANLPSFITQNRPDVILLDVSKASAERRQAYQELKAHAETQNIPLILCATSEADWMDCEAEGRLLQPIMFNEFINVLKEIDIQIPPDTKEA